MQQPRWPARAVPCALAALLAAGAAALAHQSAPNPLAPFGASEAAVRKLILDTVSGGGNIRGSGLPTLIQRGYTKIPPASRAAATTAVFAWAKAFTDSAAFTTAYARFRDEHKPQTAGNTSVDAAVTKQIEETLKHFENSRKAVEILPPADRAKALATIDQSVAQVKSPEYEKNLRSGLSAQFAATSAADAKAMSDWEATWPADHNAYVRKHLEHFLTATANIDFTLPQIWIQNPDGVTVGFLSPGMDDLPWETTHAIFAGREAVTAARAAVAAWLKEIGR